MRAGAGAVVPRRVFIADEDVRRLDRQRPTPRHGVAGVDGQVHDDLLDLPGIDEHGAQLGVPFD